MVDIVVVVLMMVSVLIRVRVVIPALFQPLEKVNGTLIMRIEFTTSTVLGIVGGVVSGRGHIEEMVL